MAGVSTSTQALVQEAMKSWVKRWQENSDNEDPFQETGTDGRAELRTASVAMEMLFNYIEDRRGFFQSPDIRLLEVEKPFAVPLDEDRPELLYIGRLDKTFEYQGRVYIAEHKTTTSYKKNGPFRDEFTESFSPNSQIDGYLYSGHLIYGKKLKAVWVDAALVHRDVHDGFRFIPIERKLQHLSAWLWETRYWIEQIEANDRALGANDYDPTEWEYMPAFPKNTTACGNYGGCPYINLCKMYTNPDRENSPGDYTVKKWEPFSELEFDRIKGVVAGFNRKVTPKNIMFDNTRVASYRACPRSFYFRHRRDLLPSQERRALLFGSSWHEAMDIVWQDMVRSA